MLAFVRSAQLGACPRGKHWPLAGRTGLLALTCTTLYPFGIIFLQRPCLVFQRLNPTDSKRAWLSEKGYQKRSSER